MFCPKCGEKQAFEETQFCARCGFPSKGVKTLLGKDGMLETDNLLSQRQKGIRQGAKLILLSFILFPAFVFLNALFPPNDILVESSPSNTWFEQISLTILWTIFLAGSARAVYAMIFEKNTAVTENTTKNPKQFKPSETKGALPPSQSIPVSDFGKWKETTGRIFEPITREKTSGALK